MKHPFVIALAAGIAVLLAAFLPTLVQTLRGGGTPAAGNHGAVTSPDVPWGAQRLPGGGLAVFGLQLPGSSLGDALARWPEGLQVAVMTRRGETGALEAYLETFRAGGITGRLVLAADVPTDTLSRWQARAAKVDPVDGRTFRLTLHADDLAEARRALLVGVSFIPGAQLDAATVTQRFGAPAERWGSDGRIEQWLYPERGLAVAIDGEGREVLQFVAPAQFERRLRAPLQASGARRLP